MKLKVDALKGITEFRMFEIALVAIPISPAAIRYIN